MRFSDFCSQTCVISRRRLCTLIGIAILTAFQLRLYFYIETSVTSLTPHNITTIISIEENDDNGNDDNGNDDNGNEYERKKGYGWTEILETTKDKVIHRSKNVNQSEKSKSETQRFKPGITKRTCAGWVPNEKREILFVRLLTWDQYQAPKGSKTGEYYMSACIDYALRQHDFRVSTVSIEEFEKMSTNEVASFYRIFYRMPQMRWHPSFDQHDILCRVRPLFYFGDWFPERDIKTRNDFPYDPKQMVVAHPEKWNTFLGYFPHNILNGDGGFPPAERGRVGLLYGKEAEYFEPYQDLIEALAAKNFTLHTTCKDRRNMKCKFPESVIRQPRVGPEEYSKLMSSYSFILGFGKPYDSPSPLVGISLGVTYLNPHRQENEKTKKTVQHKALSRLGMPYVYNVNLSDTNNVIQAAEWAVKYRFSSYVPPEFRVGAMLDRVCGILEDDALCTCPNPIFGYKEGQKKVLFDRFGSDANTMDCRASTYVQKQSVFPTSWNVTSFKTQQYFEDLHD